MNEKTWTVYLSGEIHSDWREQIAMGPGQVATLGRDIIRSVANPITKLTSAIHVYGGDFFNPPEPRSQWDHETLIEQPWDMDHTRAVFRQAEIRYNAGLAAGA